MLKVSSINERKKMVKSTRYNKQTKSKRILKYINESFKLINEKKIICLHCTLPHYEQGSGI